MKLLVPRPLSRRERAKMAPSGTRGSGFHMNCRPGGPARNPRFFLRYDFSFRRALSKPLFANGRTDLTARQRLSADRHRTLIFSWPSPGCSKGPGVGFDALLLLPK